MKDRRLVLGLTLALIALPVVLVPIQAVSFHVRNRSNGFILSSGQTRDYRLYVPASYDRSRPTPLVISMHGAGLWGAAQKDISQWNAVADREGLIVVYPSGARGSGPGIGHWDTRPGLTTDVRFLADLIDKLSAGYNIDPSRIYADGLSNGGGMAFVLSCTLSNRIAAVGMVSSAQLLPWSWCTDSRPVPMIMFHGTSDKVVPYGGGRTWIAAEAFPNVPMWAANWARRNGCAQTPVDSAVAPNVTRRTYTACVDEASVVLFTIHGGGHDWPGGLPLPEWLGGPTSHGIDASSQMWAFFRQHRLR